MKKKNKLLRNQKGSISMFVIVSVLFLTFVLIGIYASYANKLKAQEEQLGEIKENYEKYNNESDMDKLYLTQLPPKIGDYVEYDVSYTDMNTGYEFTATDGWRILDTGIKNIDGTYSNVKLISTGIPAQLYYDSSTNAGKSNNGWWGETEQVARLYDTEEIKYSEVGYGEYPNVFAAVGLIENFESIPFSVETATHNRGSYTKINLEDTEDIKGSIFKARGAAEVHNLTLQELNLARDYQESSITSTTTKDGDTGLFYLRDLGSEYNYSSSTSCTYWLAKTSTVFLRGVSGSGSILNYSSATNGVRPVVSLSAKIKIVSEGHWEIVE